MGLRRDHARRQLHHDTAATRNLHLPLLDPSVHAGNRSRPELTRTGLPFCTNGGPVAATSSRPDRNTRSTKRRVVCGAVRAAVQSASRSGGSRLPIYIRRPLRAFARVPFRRWAISMLSVLALSVAD